ncbi:hypothetical protein [Planococcus massiliensis]|nr:hypothetical protein [Planococcus massiliensis]
MAEELGTGVWTKKSGNGRSAPKGIRRASEAAPFAVQEEWLMPQGAGR